MLHPNPFIAFKRLMRLYGGIAIICASQALSHWPLVYCTIGFAGLALMLTVILPLMAETGATVAEKFPKLFDKEGVPLRRPAADRVYEIYRGAGKWEPYYDTERADNDARQVSAAEFEKLVASYDQLLKRRP